jgi:nitrogen fixation/metabolism regulation signal transduction histidine kinase
VSGRGRPALRVRLLLYLVAAHAAFALFAVAFLRHQRLWVLAVEVFLVVSLTVGVRLVRGLFAPLELLDASARLLAERDFTSRLAPLGHPEMDRLIEVYNRMADHLREERVRMQEQHHFLQRIVEASPSGIITLDHDDRITLANPAARRLLQAGEPELVGRRLQAVGSPLGEALAGIQAGESALVPYQGRRRLKCSAAHFLDRGHPRRFLLIEELTEELRRSERQAWEKILRTMSHEINNSIGASNSLLHSCLNYAAQIAPADRADFETALRVAIARTDHLNDFMGRFASVVRIPAPRRAPGDLGRLLGDVALLLRSECELRRIEWHWALAEPLEQVMMDAAQIEQVFVNVLRNAIEAMARDGRVTIRSGRRGGRRFVSVEDTGPGIPPAVAENLFTPFFSTKANGQGIGLTIVQEILNTHGFDFTLESRPGEPTRFTILVDPAAIC